MNELRIPRAKGLTQASLEYQHHPQQENKQILINNLIKQYTNQNFKYLNQNLSLEQLANLLHIGQYDMNECFLSLRASMIGLTNPEEANNLIRALNNEVILGSLADRRAVQQQLSILLQSQQNGYKAFISSEVGKTLKLMIEANRGIAEAAKMLMPSGPNNNTQINILNQLIPSDQGPTDQAQENILTTDQAVRLIDTQGINSLRNNRDEQEALFLAHNIQDTPEVNALKQGGTSESLVPTLGLNDSKATEAEGSIEDIEWEDHTNRREEMIGIVDDDSI